MLPLKLLTWRDLTYSGIFRCSVGSYASPRMDNVASLKTLVVVAPTSLRPDASFIDINYRLGRFDALDSRIPSSFGEDSV